MLKMEVLRGFVVVARSGNLSDAADLLGRTPSAVSMMLKQLEDHLGEPLFETERKNRLTTLGAFVFEQAERQLGQFNQTVRAIEDYAQARQGQVRLAAVPSVAGTLLPQALARHIDIFHDVDIEIRDMDSASIIHELVRNRIDIGIATRQEQTSGLHSVLLMTDAFGILCPPDHPLAKGSGPLDWGALGDFRLIANSLSATISADASRRLHDAALLTAHNLISLYGMVRAGLGITILPEMACRGDSAGALVFRPLSDQTARREIHLLKRRDVTLSPAAQRLEQTLVDAVSLFGGLSSGSL